MLFAFYNDFVLKYPRMILFLVVLLIAGLGYESRKLTVDASAETLLLENDKALSFTRKINARYGNPDFLVVTYAPHDGELLSDKNLENIRNIMKDLNALKRVVSVTSLLNVPLLQSPPRPVKELLKDVPTLESPSIDRKLAKDEFLNSPIYRDMLVSSDFKTTAMMVNLVADPVHQEFLARRNTLRDKEKNQTISVDEQAELKQLMIDFKAHRDIVRVEEHDNIAQVRAIMDNYRGDADLFLGGASMIADDLITYVKSDLRLFGVGVLIFLTIMLGLIFRKIRWVLIPIFCCFFSVIATAGFLGMFGWEVTVISSNFISIQLIITMAITIHLIVRYRELEKLEPESSQHQLVLGSVMFMAKPCLFASLTTIAGFASLILSGILPVINFGWMMSVGIALSLLLTFLIFPAVLMQVEKAPLQASSTSSFPLTQILANFTEFHGTKILLISTVILVLSGVGASMLRVENSFIDYFKTSTEIYQGMKIIDQQLGGTTPLDVILDFKDPATVTVAGTPVETVPPAPEPGVVAEDPAPKEDFAAIDGEDPAANEFDAEFGDEGLDEFDAEFEATQGQAQYWFTPDRMAQIEKVHDYLDQLPETGKVMSLGTLLKVGVTLNGGKPLDSFLLALVYNKLPERFREIILSPYISIDNDQVRFSVRVRDSEPDLRRNELLKQIDRDLSGKLGIPKENTHLASLLVLYNNMLQSLFDSQILTLGAVIAVLMLMFLMLFRSFSIAFIAILPNVLSVGVVLGVMGWAGIPLDLMTITIASISVGIAVDDTIHYIHRFKEEFSVDHSYINAMHRSHESIGYAMYYTSVTIIIGFSILGLSNFIPSIYFGLLTGLAMVIALIAALTLLPQLMIFMKPFGPEVDAEAKSAA